MKAYVVPTAVEVIFDTKDVISSSSGFTTDDDVFDDLPPSDGESGPPENSGGSYELPIV